MLAFPTFLLRLGVALLLGAIIGIERESNEHPAGIRTNALVALATAMITVLSGYGFAEFLSMPHVQMDPTRIASYIIAGIGFIGGGTIFFQSRIQQVKGLTTAATILVVAAVGMACGTGLLLEAVATTALALIVLVGLRYVERAIFPVTLKHEYRIHVETARGGNATTSAEGNQGAEGHEEKRGVPGQLVGQVYDACTRLGVLVESIDIHGSDAEKDKGQKMETLEVACRAKDGQQLAQVVDAIKALPGVSTVQMSAQKA